MQFKLICHSGNKVEKRNYFFTCVLFINKYFHVSFHSIWCPPDQPYDSCFSLLPRRLCKDCAKGVLGSFVVVCIRSGGQVCVCIEALSREDGQA